MHRALDAEPTGGSEEKFLAMAMNFELALIMCLW